MADWFDDNAPKQAAPAKGGDWFDQNKPPAAMVPQTETQFEKDRSFVNRAIGATQPLSTAPGAIGQTVKRAGESISDTARQAVTDPKGFAGGLVRGTGELWGGMFGAPIDKNSGPLGQRIEQFKQEYAEDPATAVKNASGDVLSMYLQGKVVEGVSEKVVPVTRKVGELLRPKAAVREAIGPGKTVARELVKDTAKENTAAATAAATENAKNAQSHLEKTQAAIHETQGKELEHERAVKAADEENTRVQQEHAKKVQTVEEANAAKLKEHGEATAQAEQIAKDAKETETQRGKLARQVKEQSARMVERIRKVKEATKAKLDAAYAEIREKTAGATVPRENLANSVTKSEGMLKGSSENIKIFRDILAKAPEEEENTAIAGKTYQGKPVSATNHPPGQPPAPILDTTTPAGFGDLQGYYSELGEKLSGGNLPSDVYLALRSLQQDIGGMMDRLATQKGVGAKLRTTQAMYRDYMQTFRESAGPNHSGSPLSQVLDAKDTDYAVKPLTEPSTASRIRNMLSRFDPAQNGVGGAGQLYDNFRNVTREYEGLEKSGKVPEAPKPPKLETTPEAPQPKLAPEPPKRVEHPDRPAEIVPERKTIGHSELQAKNTEALQAKADRISGSHSPLVSAIAGYDMIRSGLEGNWGRVALDVAARAIYGLGKQGYAKLLEQPGVVKFLTEPSAKQIAEIPPEMRGAFQKVAEQAQSQGIKVDPRLMQAIGTAGAASAPNKKVADFLK